VHVFAALTDVVEHLPFPIRGIDSDYADLVIMPTPPRIALSGSLAAGDISNSLSEADYDTELLALPHVLAGQVQSVRQQVDQYAGSNASHVTTPITEFGQLQSSVPDFAPTFHSTLQEGILIANELREWVDLGVPLAEHYLLAGSPFGSASPDPGVNKNTNAEIVGPGPNTVVEPTALVEQLFRPLGGQRQVTVQSQAVPVISLPDGSQLPDLETVAGRSGDRTTLLVINQSADTSVPASITATGNQLRTGTLTTLSAVSPLSYNTTDSPAAVSLHSHPLQSGSGQVTATFPAHSVSVLQMTFTSSLSSK
jgi:hypothetical protein